jgi:hypothetical protein
VNPDDRRKTPAEAGFKGIETDLRHGGQYGGQRAGNAIRRRKIRLTASDCISR